ncbi:hypothetical protein GBA65_04285 [Rubrobacter marinus]|uniref:Uncharacterized protein n=1 Tax=Rubrobacter marinus TaxID=2653852 RepID=A0A6G8PU52_9ACTN|nr:hypothetical protein [Rubrobacter marinus]QIN77863.1 hypothetical protein GBA65_04285 [Rubrobacter marinus]
MSGVVHCRAVRFLAVLALCAGLLVGAQSEAKADYQFGSGASTGGGHGGPDSNKYVPEYNGLVGTCYDGQVGLDRYYYDYQAWYGPLVHYIYYDTCDMNRLGATSAGWSRVYAHERAHSRGFAHYEGAPSYNASYYPKVDVY